MNSAYIKAYEDYKREWFRERVILNYITLDTVFDLMEMYSLDNTNCSPSEYIEKFGFPITLKPKSFEDWKTGDDSKCSTSS